MRLIGKEKLHKFCKKHPDCKLWIESWIVDISTANWKSLNDLKERYPSASILPKNFIIFNVKGNSYRLSVQIAVNTGVVAIKWIGTHSEYDNKIF